MSNVSLVLGGEAFFKSEKNAISNGKEELIFCNKKKMPKICKTANEKKGKSLLGAKDATWRWTRLSFGAKNVIPNHGSEFLWGLLSNQAENVSHLHPLVTRPVSIFYSRGKCVKLASPLPRDFSNSRPKRRTFFPPRTTNIGPKGI